MGGVLLMSKMHVTTHMLGYRYSLQLYGFVCKRSIFWFSRTTIVKNYDHSFQRLNQTPFRVFDKTPVQNKCPLVGNTVGMGTNAQSKTCWKCEKTINTPSIFCDSCNTLQPFDKSLDFFQIIGVCRSYDTDFKELRQKYRVLQTFLHPDKFSSKSKEEQDLSEEFSSVVNEAYTTLLNPLKRGLYLLSLHNISIEEGTTDIDKLFLVEIMERNEEIENESDPQNLKQFYTKNREQLNNLVMEVADAFHSNNLELAKRLLTKMKYYNSIELKIKQIKQKHNIPD